MIMKLLAHTDYLRMLRALSRRPMRFGAFQRELDLNPAQVDRAVKFLSREGYITARPADTATRTSLMAYTLTDRGEAVLEAFFAFTLAVNRRKDRLGARAISDLRATLVDSI
jgi:DNA-binding HxlR family transcriptional regulator